MLKTNGKGFGSCKCGTNGVGFGAIWAIDSGVCTDKAGKPNGAGEQLTNGTGLLPPPARPWPNGKGDDDGTTPPGGTGTAASNWICFFLIPGVTGDALKPDRGEIASCLGDGIWHFKGAGDAVGGVDLTICGCGCCWGLGTKLCCGFGTKLCGAL